MPRPTPESQLIAFLVALVETGNFTLAARRVGLAKSGLHKRCARDPLFAADCREAIANFLPAHPPANLASSAANRSRRGELVLLPAQGGRPAQLRRSSGNALMPRPMAHFFAILAETGNIRSAARLAGIAHSSILRRERLDPAFAEAMAEALDCGAINLELALTEAAAVYLQPDTLDPAHPPVMLPAMTYRHAIDLVERAHRRRAGAAPDDD